MLSQHLSNPGFDQSIMGLRLLDANGTFTDFSICTKLPLIAPSCLLRTALSHVFVSLRVVDLLSGCWRLRVTRAWRTHISWLSLAVRLCQISHQRSRWLVQDLVTFTTLNFVLIAWHHIILADCAPHGEISLLLFARF